MQPDLSRSIASSPQEPRVPRRIHLMTLSLVLLAVTGFAVAQADYGMNWQRVAFLFAQFLLAGTVAVFFRRIARDWPEPPAITPILVGLALVSYLREPVTRWIWETGRPFEMIAMHSLRDLILGLGAAACWIRFQRMAMLMSLFLMVFSAAIARDRAVALICGAYAVLSLSTLVSNYWETLRPRLLSVDESNSTHRWILLAVSVAVLLAVGTTEAGKPLVRVIRGYLPSSGGDGDSSPYARDGIGDGDMLVAGMDDIRTFGPIEDAPFISDHKPSLYDVFDDRYEEAVKPKQTDRAVALPAAMAAKIQERHLKKNETVSRDFSTLRQPKRGQANRKTEAVRSEALLYVSGRTPLHLRLELYDSFDGIKWQAEPEPRTEVQPALRMETVDGRPWVVSEPWPPRFDVLAERETHALKVIRFDSPKIPSPLYTCGVHIDQVDQLSMYARAHFGMLQLNRKELPEMVPIHVCSATVDRRLIPKEFPALTGGGEVHRYVPAIEGMGRIRDLANQWTQGVPRGWEQVETISRRLREEFTLDDEFRVESGCPSPVAHFLFISKRGPDYLFASAAALMLRSLGYSSRVVSGFYAAPMQYDRKSGHTPVTREDAHFWAECCLGGPCWATVEPSPGYEVLGPPPGLVARLVQGLVALGAGALRHWPALASCLVLGAAIYWGRWRLWDWGHSCLWRWRRPATTQRFVLDTLALVELRLAAQGLARPQSLSFSGWLRRLPLDDLEIGNCLQKFAARVEWAKYGASLESSFEDSIAADCRLIESQVRQSSIRQSLRLLLPYPKPSVGVEVGQHRVPFSPVHTSLGVTP